MGDTVFATIFSIFGILSIVAGVLLIFLIFVMMAAERRSEMGMARAIGVQRSHVVQMFVTEGVIYDLLAATLGVLLGLAISYAIVGFIGPLFNSAAEQLTGQAGSFQIHFHAAPTSLVIAYCLGVLFTFVVVTLASWRVSRLNIVAAIRDLEEPPGPGRTSRLGRTARLLFGPLLATLGALLLYDSGNSLGLIQAGASLLMIGFAYLLGWFLEQRERDGERVQRIVYSIIGVGLLATWALPWGAWFTPGGRMTAAVDSWFLLKFVLGMVALTFLLESSFIALTGIGVGASVGMLLGETLVSTSYETLADGRLFGIPWAALGLILLIAYGSSLLTTILPALQASHIYPADALRYE